MEAFKIKKIRSIIYLLCFICLLAASIYFTIIEMNNATIWVILYLLCAVISFYYIILHGIDLFNKDSGFKIDEQGLTLDFEYFKKEFAPIGIEETALPIPASLAPIGIINPLNPTCTIFFFPPKDDTQIVKIKTDKIVNFNNFFIVNLQYYQLKITLHF